MFFCIINIDLLDDDYYYRLILNVNKEEVCDSIVKRINDGEYKANYAKNCVYAEFSNNEEFLNKSVQILDENDAIKFIENFLEEYDKDISYLEDNYKLELVYFVDEDY